jgi:cyanophycin synthetase
MAEGRAPVRLVELRVLDGPNVYFTRPAIKLTLAAPGLLGADGVKLATTAERLGAKLDTGAGPPQTEHRRRVAARLLGQLTRRIAVAGGAPRLAIRARPGPGPDEVVVAYPWRRRTAAEALGHEVATAAGALLRRSPDRLVAEAGRRLVAVEPGPEPAVPDPDVPVIQVTGTNGKTTTVRLLAHLVRTAGRTVAYSSTDGVFRDDGELVEAGDYSGFGGAAMALAQHPDVAVLETARGGMLLRGVGVLHNDVAVVTNVSEDHLGLHGVDTVDQLAEVKGIVTRITRPDGWDVLNADDPRVLAMRRHAAGRPWLFAVHPGHPGLRDALAEGGRAMTVLDGRLTWIERQEAHPLVPLVDLPVTLAGLSTVHVQNAMAAAAAALAVGLPERAVIRGLRTFLPDPDRNPGRANLFRLDGRLIVIDYAHNEAGMAGLAEVLAGLRRPDHDVWLAVCTAGDRTDRILHAFALRAALAADHLGIAELVRYLRGRSREDITTRLREGAAEVGVHDVPVYEDELHALRSMVTAARPGDVVAVTALGMRPEIFAWLDRAGASRLRPGDVRRIARRAAARPAAVSAPSIRSTAAGLD